MFFIQHNVWNTLGTIFNVLASLVFVTCIWKNPNVEQTPPIFYMMFMPAQATRGSRGMATNLKMTHISQNLSVQLILSLC